MVELDPRCDKMTADVVEYVERNGLTADEGASSYSALLSRYDTDEHAIEAHEYALCYQAVARQVREWKGLPPDYYPREPK